MKTRLWTFVTGITLVLCLLAPGLPARAEGEGQKTTWAVAPADANGPDGRRVMEVEADPGERVDEFFAVTNLSDHEVTFSLNAADGYFNEKGRFNTIPSDQDSVGPGTWITVDPEVTVPAHESTVIPLAIEVPVDAEPGDHAAGVSASILQVSTDGSGSRVGVESRVGFRLTIGVTGEARPEASIADVKTSYAVNWNPIKPGSAKVTFTVRNTGNLRFAGRGVLNIAGQEVAYPAADQPQQELLPGDSRTFEVEADEIWPTFIVGGELELRPAGVGERSESVDFPTISANADVTAIPWPQLIVLLGVALIVVASLTSRRRGQAKIADLVAQAREEGRRAAQEEGS